MSTRVGEVDLEIALLFYSQAASAMPSLAMVVFVAPFPS